MQGEASGSPQLLQIFVKTYRQVSSEISGDPKDFFVFQRLHLRNRRWYRMDSNFLWGAATKFNITF